MATQQSRTPLEVVGSIPIGSTIIFLRWLFFANAEADHNSEPAPDRSTTPLRRPHHAFLP
jgi:hypothetical protein